MLKMLINKFPSPKLRPPIDLQTNVVYKISCNDCSWNYIGETGRCFSTRKKNIPRMSRAALKDLTSEIMLGRTIIQLTLRIQLSSTKAIIVCEKLLNHGILQ